MVDDLNCLKCGRPISGVIGLCPMCAEVERVIRQRAERVEPAPKFASLDTAAEFVMTRPRLLVLVRLGEAEPFIRYLFAHADGTIPLPILMSDYFTDKIDHSDKEQKE
jgi:hypothetical protein